MLGAFVIHAAAWFHRFWAIDDQQQKYTELMNFLRNAAYLGACLALFAFFATVGHELRFTVTDPLFDLR